MVPFLQLHLNSVNNTPCPRVYTLLRLCSSLCFATKGMSVVAATNVVVDTPPRNGGEEKEKFIGAPFPFSPSFIGRSPPPVFPFYSPDFRGRFSSSRCLTRFPTFLSPFLAPRSCIASLKYPRFWRGLILPERDREGRREERGVEIGTGLEIILILVRGRNYLLGIAVIRNNGWCEIFGFFWTRKIEISTRFQDFAIF